MIMGERDQHINSFSMLSSTLEVCEGCQAWSTEEIKLVQDRGKLPEVTSELYQ